MSEPAKISTKAMITIEPMENGGFNSDKVPTPEMKKAGDLALLGMLAIAKALELQDAQAATKTTIH